MREVGRCPAGCPSIRKAKPGPKQIVAIQIIPTVLASACYAELVDADENVTTTSADSTSPRNFRDSTNAPEKRRKPFSEKIPANLGPKWYHFEGSPLTFDKGIEIGYAENCIVRAYER